MILPVADFRKVNSENESANEHKSLTERFESILEELGIEDWYEPIEYDKLDEDTRNQIDALNLLGILQEQIQGNSEIDLPVTRFVLRRLAQLDDTSAIDLVLDNIRRLYPVFADALQYLTAMRSLDMERRREIGHRLLQLIDTDVVGHLEFHRAWILHTFAENREWDNEDKFVDLFNRYSDQFSRRELILALGRAHNSPWFKMRKRSLNEFSHWTKRAFIAAASCLPGDEARFWYKSIMPQLDPLEKAVLKWAKKNPFS